MLPETIVLSRLLQWGNSNEAIRCMILTSSRTNPNGPVDALSDFDIVVAVTDIDLFIQDEAWLNVVGPVLVMYRDPLRLEHGAPSFARITQYDDTKVDFTIWQVEGLRHMVDESQRNGRLEEDYDLGYRVLLDKDGLTAAMPAPTYQAYIPTPPSEARYHEVIELFFHEATYAAKNLWRRDLMPAKYFLDSAMKLHNLRYMLEWRMEIEHGWTVRTGVLARGLMRHLPDSLRAAVTETYVGPDLADNWRAFYGMVDVFRQTAREVGTALGYSYPEEMDRRCMDYYHRVQALPRD